MLQYYAYWWIVGDTDPICQCGLGYPAGGGVIASFLPSHLRNTSCRKAFRLQGWPLATIWSTMSVASMCLWRLGAMPAGVRNRVNTSSRSRLTG